MSDKKPLVNNNCFISFQASTAAYALPQRFTFPFYYEPHPLAVLAVKELQQYLQTQTVWTHNFGLEAGKEEGAAGKMFGVLVVQNQEKELGYLVAFSGRLAGGNRHSKFVPPVFDILTKDGFFNKEEAVINQINREIEVLEADATFLEYQALLVQEQTLANEQRLAQKQKMKAAKQARKMRREKAIVELSPPLYEILKETLQQESIASKVYLKKLSEYWKTRLAETTTKLASYTQKINSLKEARKVKSGALQKKLFDQYTFLNQAGETKSLWDIFQSTVQKTPPAGGGDCAAPKLLQYAFRHQLQPITMAEFWWGAAPKSKVRKHQHFYPACRGKCEPILAHMLKGIPIDENPMLLNPAIGKVLTTVYEDDHLLVINKPAEFLSVPGKSIKDSVLLRIQQKFPDATGPLLVHRLDMATSGLLLVAKTKEVHKYLQYQFINRTIKKRYVALLKGQVQGEEGMIDLPLRVDLDNRPCQLVCYQYGKPAKTKWKVIERLAKHTKVHFYPITGRTHQLRVHAAHSLGLNTAIVGDDLYGTKASRLHLHAERLTFKHPFKKKMMTVKVEADF